MRCRHVKSDLAVHGMGSRNVLIREKEPSSSRCLHGHRELIGLNREEC